MRYQDPARQLELFNQAVALLGGPRATARVMELAETTVRDMVKGRRQIHAKALEGICRKLEEHAAACRSTARNLSPAFAENLTANQIPGHKNRWTERRHDAQRGGED